MIGYYFVNRNGTEYLHVPLILFSYRHLNRERPCLEFKPDVLQKLNSAMQNKRMSIESFQERGWDYEEINIPDRMIKSFTNSCFRKGAQKTRKRLASRIFDWANDHSEIGRHNDEDIENEIEDYEDNWWDRGDSPPDYEFY